MFKRFIRKIFNNTGVEQCRYKSPTFNFIYFTNNDREKLEAFFGDTYDYDFTDYGVMVWEDPICLNNVAWRLTPRYFQYNTYIVKEVTKDGYFKFSWYSKKDFDEKYEILNK